MIVDMPVLSEVVKMFGNPIKLSDMPQHSFKRAPNLGENNNQILKNFLGMDDRKINELKNKGVI